MPATRPLPLIASLRAALEAARGVRTRADLHEALERIAGEISRTLGYRSVVVNLHRPEWDDFEAVTVVGAPEAREALLHQTSTWVQWAPYLAPRFERLGVHHVPAEHAPPDPEGLRLYRPAAPAAQSAAAWDPDDLTLVVMHRSNGDVLGILSVDEPVSGLRPDDADLDQLQAIGQIAALAVEQAQDARRDAEHRGALERLLSVSSRIADQRSRGGVLEEVCSGIRDALGFQRVAVLLAENGGHLRPAATAGWTLHDPVFASVAFTMEDLAPILAPANERHGCYLLEREDAEATLGLESSIYRSQSNGRGPYAWERHWLLVPLGSGDGARGVIWADDPADRLLPGRERLQALRLFADQAAAALEAARDFEATSHRAEHDALTGLANRDRLSERLQHALQRQRRSGPQAAVLFIDLDRFKEANDSLGHAAGDELLRIAAARIDEAVRPGDTVARFGGDEFVVLCEDVTGPDDAMEVAERLRTALAEPVPLASGVAAVTASIGVALPDHPARSAEELLQAADRAMYEAKAAGRDAARLAAPGAGWQ